MHNVLKQIAKREKYDPPKNDQLFDLLPLEEGTKAYYLIGEKGKNKADYFIGSGEPKTLAHYFDQFNAAITGMEYSAVNFTLSGDQILGIDAFSIDELINDTGFERNVTFKDFIKRSVKQ